MLWRLLLLCIFIFYLLVPVTATSLARLHGVDDSPEPHAPTKASTPDLSRPLPDILRKPQPQAAGTLTLSETPFKEWVDRATWAQYLCQKFLEAGDVLFLSIALRQLHIIQSVLAPHEATVAERAFRLYSHYLDLLRAHSHSFTLIDDDAAHLADRLFKGHYPEVSTALRHLLENVDYQNLSPSMKNVIITVGLMQYDGINPESILPLWEHGWKFSQDEKISALIRAKQLTQAVRRGALNVASLPPFRSFPGLHLVDSRVLANACQWSGGSGPQDSIENLLLSAGGLYMQTSYCDAQHQLSRATQTAMDPLSKEMLLGMTSRIAVKCHRTKQLTTYRAFCQVGHEAAFPIAEAMCPRLKASLVASHERMFWTRLTLGDCQGVEQDLKNIRIVVPDEVIARRDYIRERLAFMEEKARSCRVNPGLLASSYGRQMMYFLEKGDITGGINYFTRHFQPNQKHPQTFFWRAGLMIMQYPKAVYAPCTGNSLLSGDPVKDLDLFSQIERVAQGQQSNCGGDPICTLTWMKAAYIVGRGHLVLETLPLVQSQPHLADEGLQLAACVKLCFGGQGVTDACDAIPYYTHMSASFYKTPQNVIGSELASGMCQSNMQLDLDSFYVRGGESPRPVSFIFRHYYGSHFHEVQAPEHSFFHHNHPTLEAKQQQQQQQPNTSQVTVPPPPPVNQPVASLAPGQVIPGGIQSVANPTLQVTPIMGPSLNGRMGETSFSLGQGEAPQLANLAAPTTLSVISSNPEIKIAPIIPSSSAAIPLPPQLMPTMEIRQPPSIPPWSSNLASSTPPQVILSRFPQQPDSSIPSQIPSSGASLGLAGRNVVVPNGQIQHPINRTGCPGECTHRGGGSTHCPMGCPGTLSSISPSRSFPGPPMMQVSECQQTVKNVRAALSSDHWKDRPNDGRSSGWISRQKYKDGYSESNHYGHGPSKYEQRPCRPYKGGDDDGHRRPGKWTKSQKHGKQPENCKCNKPHKPRDHKHHSKPHKHHPKSKVHKKMKKLMKGHKLKKKLKKKLRKSLKHGKHKKPKKHHHRHNKKLKKHHKHKKPKRHHKHKKLRKVKKHIKKLKKHHKKLKKHHKKLKKHHKKLKKHHKKPKKHHKKPKKHHKKLRKHHKKAKKHHKKLKKHHKKLKKHHKHKKHHHKHNRKPKRHHKHKKLKKAKKHIKKLHRHYKKSKLNKRHKKKLGKHHKQKKLKRYNKHHNRVKYEKVYKRGKLKGHYKRHGRPKVHKAYKKVRKGYKKAKKGYKKAHKKRHYSGYGLVGSRKHSMGMCEAFTKFINQFAFKCPCHSKQRARKMRKFKKIKKSELKQVAELFTPDYMMCPTTSTSRQGKIIKAHKVKSQRHSTCKCTCAKSVYKKCRAITKVESHKKVKRLNRRRRKSRKHCMKLAHKVQKYLKGKGSRVKRRFKKKAKRCSKHLNVTSKHRKVAAIIRKPSSSVCGGQFMFPIFGAFPYDPCHQSMSSAKFGFIPYGGYFKPIITKRRSFINKSKKSHRRYKRGKMKRSKFRKSHHSCKTSKSTKITKFKSKKYKSRCGKFGLGKTRKVKLRRKSSLKKFKREKCKFLHKSTKHRRCRVKKYKTRHSKRRFRKGIKGKRRRGGLVKNQPCSIRVLIDSYLPKIPSYCGAVGFGKHGISIDLKGKLRSTDMNFAPRKKIAKSRCKGRLGKMKKMKKIKRKIKGKMKKIKRKMKGKMKRKTRKPLRRFGCKSKKPSRKMGRSGRGRVKGKSKRKVGKKIRKLGKRMKKGSKKLGRKLKKVGKKLKKVGKKLKKIGKKLKKAGKKTKRMKKSKHGAKRTKRKKNKIGKRIKKVGKKTKKAGKKIKKAGKKVKKAGKKVKKAGKKVKKAMRKLFKSSKR